MKPNPGNKRRHQPLLNQEKKRATSKKAKKTQPLEDQFDLEAFEPRLMLDASPLASLDADGKLTLNLTPGDDSVIVSRIGVNADSTEIIKIKNVATGVVETYGDKAAGAASGVKAIFADGGDGNDVLDFSTGVAPITSPVTVVGGTGNDTLIAPDRNNAWLITGQDTGKLNTNFDFSGVENLTGATGKNDTFTIKSGGKLTGSLQGQAAATGQGSAVDSVTVELALGATAQTLTFGAGSIALNGGTLAQYSRITSAQNVVIVGTDGVDDISVSAGAGGTIEFSGSTLVDATVNAFGTISVQAPSGSLKLAAGGSGDTVTVRTAGLSTPLTVVGGDEEVDKLIVAVQADGNTHAVNFAQAAAGSGSITVDALTISYSGIEDSQNLDITTTGGADTMELAAGTGASTGKLVLRSTTPATFQAITFDHPASSLSIHAGAGADSLTVLAGAAYAGELLWDGGAGVDTIIAAGTINRLTITPESESVSGSVKNFTWSGTAIRDNVTVTREPGRKIRITNTTDLPEYNSNIVIDEPTESLTISTGFNAAGAAEKVTVGALGDFGADLIINTGKTVQMEDGPDEVTIGSINLAGRKLQIIAETITVADGTVLSTSKAGGVAGEIQLVGWHINIGNNAQLLAQGATPGSVKLWAIRDRAIFTPLLNIDISDVRVTVGDGAQIRGGAVEILATADSQALQPSDPRLEDLNSSSTESTIKEGLAKLGSIVEGLTQIGAGVSVGKATANIDLGLGSQISATTLVAHASAKVRASTAPITFMVGPALGIALTDANVNVKGSITTTGDATIRSQTDHILDVVSDVSGLKGIAGALAVGVLDSHTTANVSDDAVLNIGGNLYVHADTVNRSRVMARSTAGEDGKVGVAVAVDVELSEINAFLDGKAIVGGNVNVTATETREAVPINKLFVFPGLATGVTAKAGVGSSSTGDLMDDTKSGFIGQFISGPIKDFIFKKGTLPSKDSLFKDRAPNPRGSNTYDIAGAMGVGYNRVNATARIGDGGADGDSKFGEVEAGGALEVKALVTDRPFLSSSSSASKDPNADESAGSNKFDGSLAIGVGIYDHSAHALINSNAQVTAHDNLVVDSKVLNDWVPVFGVDLFNALNSEATHKSGDGQKTININDTVEVSTDYQGKGEPGHIYQYIGSVPQRTTNLGQEDYTDATLWKDLGSVVTYKAKNFVGSLTGYLNDSLGVEGTVVDSWSQATADSDEMALAGALQFQRLNFTADALIKSGAKINQTRPEWGGSGRQNVKVEATGINELVAFAGNIEVLGLVGNNQAHVQPFLPKVVPPGVGSNGDGSAVGATGAVYNFENHITARIEDGVQLKADSLEVDASTQVMTVDVGASGGKSKKFSFNGVVLGNVITNTTIASIENGATINVGNGSVSDPEAHGASLFVQATDNTVAVNVLGGITASETVGIGASVGLNVLVRDTEAYIGSRLGDDVIGTRGSVTSGGSVAVDAKNSGFVGVFAVAGSKTDGGDPGSGQPGADDPVGLKDKNGNDQDDPGKLPNNQKNYDSVLEELKLHPKFRQAAQDTGAGGTDNNKSVSSEKGKAGVSISGAVAINVDDSDARAYIRNTGAFTVQNGDLSVTASNSAIVASLGGGCCLCPRYC